jgi:hypothetical protein
VLEGLLGPQRTLQLIAQANTITDPDRRHLWLVNLIKMLVANDKEFLAPISWVREPVDAKTFLCSQFYLNKASEVYPPVLREFEEMNSGRYDEAVLTGGIGSAKTTIALYSQAYQLYVLSCMANPQQSFGLDSSSELKMIFQSLRKSTAKTVDFNRFYNLIAASPYFKTVFPFDRSLTSILRFDNNIEVEPVSGSETASIGQNIIGGIIDEINFMAVVENSKQSADGGTYNQAVELYNSIARRRKSRFMQAGRNIPGLLCVVSSKRIPGEFTDTKMEEAKENPRIFVYDKRVWDIKPHAFCGDMFPLFVGDAVRRPRVLTEQEAEELPEQDMHLLDHVPVEFAQEFKEDITKALRDIAGHSTLATAPFMPNSEMVVSNFGKGHNVVRDQVTDFQTMPCIILPKRFKNLQYPRYCHIDLALTGDSAGVVIGHVPRFVLREEEMCPEVHIDMVLEVRPPPAGEIQFNKIRSLLYKLRDLGMPIQWVSLDSYQSRDTVQILRQKGFAAGIESMDTSMVPYSMLKRALYDQRVMLPHHDLLQKELVALEINHKKKKVDHNAYNSKDVADALAGVVYGICLRREVWGQHGIAPTEEYLSASRVKEETAEYQDAETA